MSWLKSAVTRAVAASGSTPVGRSVKTYAGTVVQHAGQAVTDGARIIHDRIGTRDYSSLKHTTQKLEEAIVSCRGEERTELLRQILLALNRTERTNSSDEVKSLEQILAFEPRKAPLVLVSESDFEGDSMSFRDVFLHSHMLEGVVLSMILDAPNEEEVLLLLEIFGLCLTGDKEVHSSIMSSIQQLSASFSNYHDEVLVKQDELLQFAQTAISGVKLNTNIARIDAEASSLWKRIEGIEALYASTRNDQKQEAEKADFVTVEGMNKALADVQLCSKLEALLLKKKSTNNGDSAETHYEKVDKLKVLAESLANSSLKAETRISDHRHQLEEALNFRISKASEVMEIEKGITNEVAQLERERDRLEAELMKVNMSLKSALVSLNKHREERNHFDEASNQIIMHLKSKENELSRSIDSFNVEADTVKAWINFLEKTWTFQSSYITLKEKHADDELEKYGTCFLRLIKHHLLAYKELLRPSIDHIKALVDSLNNRNKRSDQMLTAASEVPSNEKSRETLEKEYSESEWKIVNAIGVVDRMKELFYTAEASRRQDPEVQELFDVIEQMKGEFRSIERPKLDSEASKVKAKSPGGKSTRTTSFASAASDPLLPKRTESPESVTSARYAGADLSEFVDASGDWGNEEILGWELD